MTLFQPFRQSPDAADFDRDEKRFNDSANLVDAIVARGTILTATYPNPGDCCEKCGEHLQTNRPVQSAGNFTMVCGLCADDIFNGK